MLGNAKCLDGVNMLNSNNINQLVMGSLMLGKTYLKK
ncbi:hypothetical protein DFH89_000585 [Clostridium saccharobutylicum]|nr:hypothetical protein [Clostridium saccharobutylicum]NYC43689.1 hypothetical protein [Clostridium saccharobutylicum]